MTAHFSAYMYRLQYIQRWSLMRSVHSQNVAEHCFHVATLAHLLCTIGNEQFGKQLNADRAATLSLFHDATEVFTGDIPTPVKHHNPTILKNFRAIESIATERLLSMLPSDFQEVYAEFFTSSSEEKRYVKAADILESYLKCTIELTAGNHEFAVAKRQALKQLHQLQMPEVDYFLTMFAPSFEKTLDELS